MDFWQKQRLGYQLDLAATNGAPATLIDGGRRLQEGLAAFYRDYRPTPSLLHGDLWGGNWAADEIGRPVIYDPATYYGDREADLAMTELFGGFEPAFYSAYQAHSPLADGYELRRDLYKLYHMLNHLNLFGGGYLSSCENLIDQLLAETG